MPGSIIANMPPRDDDPQRKQRDLERQAREQAAAKSGQAMQIGAGGIIVKDGGSITIEGTGALNTNGAISTAASLHADTTITAGGAITAGGVISTPSNIHGGGLVSDNSLAVANGGSFGGALTAPTGRFDSGLFSLAAYSTNITGTRVANWTQNDGTIGTASSDENVKTDIVDSMLSSPDRAQLILEQFEALHYQYKSEVARRDYPTSPSYVGPDYNVHVELGSTAQRVHALGLWEVVVYDRELVTKTETTVADDGSFVQTTVVVGDTLKLDENGNPSPIGLHYELFGLVAIAAAQYLYSLVKQNTADIAAIKQHLGL